VWNRTPRGEGYTEVEEEFASESEYSDESGDYVTDGYSDEEDEDRFTDDDDTPEHFFFYGGRGGD
jgi:hypothetical protein